MIKDNKLIKLCFSFFAINLFIFVVLNMLGARIVTLALKADNPNEIQFFYSANEVKDYNESNSSTILYKPSKELTKMRILIFDKNLEKFRIDFGNSPSKYEVSYLSISDGMFFKRVWNSDYLIRDFTNNNQIEMKKIDSNRLEINALGDDGFLSGKNITGEAKINIGIFLLEAIIVLFLLSLLGIQKVKVLWLKLINIKFINNINNNLKGALEDIKLEINRIREYTVKNKYIIYISIFFIALAHGTSLFYYKISIDTETSVVRGYSDIWIRQGRFGIALLQKVFSLNSVTVPIYNNFLGLIMLVLFVILSLYIINKYSNINNKLANVSFLVIFLTFPQISHYMTFTIYSFEVSFGYFIVALSVLFISRFILDKSAKLDLILGIILLMFSISIYQSFLTLYIAFICIIFIINKWNYEQINKTNEFINIIKFILALIFAICIYFIVNFILIHSFISIDGLSSFYMKWGKDNVFMIILKIISDIKQIIFANNFYGLEMLKISYIVLCMFVFIFLSNRSMRIKSIYLVVFMISPFLLNIALGSYQPLRALETLPFLVGIASYLMIRIFKSRTIKYIIFTALLLLGMYQAQCTSSLYFGDYIRYKQDCELGNSIAQRIEALNLREDTQYPVVYIGSHSQYASNNFIIKNEVLGYSFFEWDCGNIDRIRNFMDILGHNYISPSDKQIKTAYNISKKMPVWPNSQSVKFEDNVIVVKLSEPTETWINRYNGS